MKLVRIDIGKNKHSFAIMNKDDGEILVKPDFLIMIRMVLNHSYLI